MVRNIDTYSCTFRGIYGVNKIASLVTSPNKTMLSVHESVSGRVIFRLGDENGYPRSELDWTALNFFMGVFGSQMLASTSPRTLKLEIEN